MHEDAAPLASPVAMRTGSGAVAWPVKSSQSSCAGQSNGSTKIVAGRSVPNRVSPFTSHHHKTLHKHLKIVTIALKGFVFHYSFWNF
jgi:hypothetical protein